MKNRCELRSKTSTMRAEIQGAKVKRRKRRNDEPSPADDWPDAWPERPELAIFWPDDLIESGDRSRLGDKPGLRVVGDWCGEPCLSEREARSTFWIEHARQCARRHSG